ncbi:unnamed protein product [Nesidiocoris tenuis]|uniref:Uncharacterized protein n=1 Tax=Nesidiocoris tenuis TaxID=355587 RepID=A0A6H5FZ78_9HEMI|nr:unnamed protein product [Nesidiocoris tenuis]CAA9998349.1 unnamed protein product [Nesidiocoris tenuis]
MEIDGIHGRSSGACCGRWALGRHEVRGLPVPVTPSVLIKVADGAVRISPAVPVFPVLRRYISKKEKLTAEEGADLLDTYLRIERDIYREERSPPAPALGHAMVKLDRMAGELDSAMVDMSSEREDLVQIPGTVPEMDTINNDSRWRLAQDARNSLHEAVLCVQAAMTSLPGVQFPYCSMRELQALMQVRKI